MWLLSAECDVIDIFFTFFQSFIVIVVIDSVSQFHGDSQTSVRFLLHIYVEAGR